MCAVSVTISALITAYMLSALRHQSWALSKMIITKIQKSSSRFDFLVPARSWTSESPLLESFSGWKWSHQLTRSQINTQGNLHFGITDLVQLLQLLRLFYSIYYYILYNSSSGLQIRVTLTLLVDSLQLIVLWDNNANIYLYLISPVIQSLPIILLQLGVGQARGTNGWDDVVFSVYCLRVEEDDLYLPRVKTW